MYADSAYPLAHTGSTGAAFAAGAKGKNLTEWQFGLASVRPRWNVSGTYMQVLPRFVSTDADGGDGREFLYKSFHALHPHPGLFGAEKGTPGLPGLPGQPGGKGYPVPRAVPGGV